MDGAHADAYRPHPTADDAHNPGAWPPGVECAPATVADGAVAWRPNCAVPDAVSPLDSAAYAGVTVWWVVSPSASVVAAVAVAAAGQVALNAPTVLVCSPCAAVASVSCWCCSDFGAFAWGCCSRLDLMLAL